jgi:1-acyl-sn-glycerol-3-phosphate acyltransferase
MDVTEQGTRPGLAPSSAVWWFGGLMRLLLVSVTRLFTGVALRPGARAQLERLAGGPRILFANHNSLADFITLWTVMPGHLRRRVRPVAAADHWGRSVWRRFLAREVFNAVLIERSGHGDTRVGFEAMRSALAQGDALIFFPEGTRNMGEDPLQPFKPGLYLLAQACPAASLVPVWLDQTRRVLPKGAELPVPALCTVNIGAAMLWSQHEPCEVFLRRAESAVLALRPGALAAATVPHARVDEARAA